MSGLPIYACKWKLDRALSLSPVTIVVGQTGSGKTTQVPQWALDTLRSAESERKVIVTQPTSISARLVADRVARERGVVVGKEVGYSIRFEHMCSAETKITFATDEILLKILSSDWNLSEYGYVIIDEAHERTLATELLLAAVKRILISGKSTLKLVIMSATITANRFRAYFTHERIGNVAIVESSIRHFGLTIKYMNTRRRSDLVENAVKTCIMIHGMNQVGDVLVFAAGSEEIHEISNRIERIVSANPGSLCPIRCYPLYSELPSDIQKEIETNVSFSVNGFYVRKVIVATEYAESSLTIPNIKFVIDGGKVMSKDFDFREGLSSLTVANCSRASANQRAGRAGRTGHGVVYRLYDHHHFEKEMAETKEPAIVGSELASAMLQLRVMGFKNILRCDLMTIPCPLAVARAREDLVILGAIDRNGVLKEKGKKMAAFPLEPKLSAMILHASEEGCVEELLAIVAMLEVSPVFFRPTYAESESGAARDGLEHTCGDLFTLLNVYKAYKNQSSPGRWCVFNFIVERSMQHAHEQIVQMQKICANIGIAWRSAPTLYPATYNVGSIETITKIILSANLFQLAYCPDDEQKYHVFLPSNTKPVRVHGASVYALKDDPRINSSGWVCYEELSIEGSGYIRGLTQITPEIIRVVASSDLREKVMLERGFVADALKQILGV